MNWNRIAAFLLAGALAALAGEIPPGFKRIFDGKDLKGWHISQVTNHGKSQDWTVVDGVLSGGQDPPGNGGILLTDKKYRNYEIYMEIKPDWGCDGGLFLRSNEKGQSYQVQINYLPNDFVGGISGEGLGPNETTIKMARAEGWEKLWKKDDWNSLRARIEGDIPHITVWINGTKITDWTDTENHLIGGAADGEIALQVHGGKGRWALGAHHRFRNIAIKEL
jgi:hypothetical protein